MKKAPNKRASGKGEMPQQWYSVRSIFRFDKPTGAEPGALFEERVVLFRAATPEEALEKGRAEANRYSQGETRPKMLTHIVAFSIWEEELADGEEIWSCLRLVDISDEEFLSRFYEGERLGLRHVE